MRPAATRGLALLALATAACGSHTKIDDHPCPPAGTTLTYASFGQPFLARWCQRCHGGEETSGHGVDLGSREAVARARRDVFAQAADENSSMPVGPDEPTPEERHRLGEWLACGAP